jgi:hypothetical protein
MSSIFSTYSTGENRVTASILAVLRSLSLDRIQRLLGNLLEDSEFELVQFENQPSNGGRSVPDAIILSSCRILVETKIKRNTVKVSQIEEHLRLLDRCEESTAVLLIVTPDDARPTVLETIKEQRFAWTSFASLDEAIDNLLVDPHEVVSEREAFLLRELQRMLANEELIGNENDVVVVAARSAWQEYNDLHAYVCQPNRLLRAKRIAFYSKNKVYELVPAVLESKDVVEMTRGIETGAIGDLVNRLLDERRRIEGKHYKVVLLSAPNAPETIKLSKPIPNDKKSKSGKGTAFTMGQRYVSLEALKSAKTTSDLE